MGATGEMEAKEGAKEGKKEFSLQMRRCPRRAAAQNGNKFLLLVVAFAFRPIVGFN